MKDIIKKARVKRKEREKEKEKKEVLRKEFETKRDAYFSFVNSRSEKKKNKIEERIEVFKKEREIEIKTFYQSNLKGLKDELIKINIEEKETKSELAQLKEKLKKEANEKREELLNSYLKSKGSINWKLDNDKVKNKKGETLKDLKKRLIELRRRKNFVENEIKIYEFSSFDLVERKDKRESRQKEEKKKNKLIEAKKILDRKKIETENQKEIKEKEESEEENYLALPESKKKEFQFDQDGDKVFYDCFYEKVSEELEEAILRKTIEESSWKDNDIKREKRCGGLRNFEFNIHSGIFNWKPDFFQFGKYKIVVEARDGSRYKEKNKGRKVAIKPIYSYIDIKKKNHRPILKLFSEGKRVVAPLEGEISFDLLEEEKISIDINDISKPYYYEGVVVPDKDIEKLGLGKKIKDNDEDQDFDKITYSCFYKKITNNLKGAYYSCKSGQNEEKEKDNVDEMGIGNLDFNPFTAEFSWIPNHFQKGVYQFKIVGEDNLSR